MLPINLWERQAQIKSLYSICVEPVCKKYYITRTELDILLFLVNNPKYDTAAEIVEIRYLTKSHVSTSVKHLEELGYLHKFYANDNQKAVHLAVKDEASDVIADGKKAQEKFISILFEGVSKDECMAMEKSFQKIGCNIKRYFEETLK